MKTTITSMAIALLIAVTANADVIHQSDFEAEPATGFGIGAATMEFTDGGGSLIGFSNNGGAGTTGDALGISNANANSGSFHRVVDTGATAGTTTWGSSWSGQSDKSGSGGFTSQAAAEAAGAGCYVEYSVGSTFTVTAEVATDATDALTGAPTAAVRLEYYYAIDNDGDGIADVTRELGNLARTQGNGFDAGTLTTAYQTSTATYTLTAADLDFANITADPGETVVGFDRVVGVMGTDNNDPANSDGLIYYDDFVFEVDAGSVVLVGSGHAVPEPSSAVILAGLLGLCGLRRKKS